MKKNDIVSDDQGNHFRVLAVLNDIARLESVVTKAIFVAPIAELQPTDRVAF